MACTETFSTLRIHSSNISPDEISHILGIDATQISVKDPESKYKPVRDGNYWAFCTEKKITSQNNNEHIQFILDNISDKSELLDNLRLRGCKTDISNYWTSNGQGGPSISLEIMQSLLKYKLPIYWDMYFDDE
ncbi:DUF4279 domain-containing protein [Pseudoalteromonas sp. SIMBA_148]